jgi:hypothetical protein
MPHLKVGSSTEKRETAASLHDSGLWIRYIGRAVLFAFLWNRCIFALHHYTRWELPGVALRHARRCA